MKTTFVLLAATLLLLAAPAFAATTLVTINPAFVSDSTGITQAFQANIAASCDLSTAVWTSNAGQFGTNFWAPAGNPTEAYFATGPAGRNQPQVSYAISLTVMCGGNPTTARAIINVYPLL